MSDNNIDPELLKQFAEALVTSTREMDPKIQADKLAAQKAKELAEEMNNLKKQVKQSSIDLVKLSASSNHGAAKYGEAIESVAGAAGKMIALAGPLGMLGKVVGGIIGIFGQLANASLKQNDQLMSTYQSLGKFGANSTADFRNLLDNLHRAGFSVDNAEQFVTSLKKVSPELALFGGSVGEGSKKLTHVFTRSLGETERQLAKLGYTSEEMFDFTGSLIAQQSVIGVARLKTEKQLNQESVDYMKTLAELSMLTGLQRDDIDKARRANENDARYQWKLRRLQMSDREEDREYAKNIQYQVDTATAKGMTSTAEFLKSFYANGEQVVDEFGVMGQQMYGNSGLQKFAESAHKAGDAAINTLDAYQYAGQQAKRNADNFEAAIATSKDGTKGWFDALDALKAATMSESYDKEKALEAIRKINEKVENDRVEENTKRKQNERKLNFTMEDITYSVGNKVVPAMTKLTDISTKLGKWFAKLIKILSLGTVDYTKEFKSATDVMVDAKEDMEEFQRTTKEIKDLEEQKKHVAKGSKAEASIDQRLSALKASQRSSAKNLLGAQSKAEELGGTVFNDKTLARLHDVADERKQVSAVSDEDYKNLDSLLNFTGGSGSKDAFNKLSGPLAAKVLQAAKEYKELTNGRKLTVNSAFRSLEEQERLYADYQSGRSKIPAAPPGKSRHQSGAAIDIQEYNDPLAIKALNNAGLVQKISDDPVHFEGAYNGAIFNGPKSGYWTKLHGTEGVFNEKQMATLSNALTRNPLNGGGGSSINTASSEFKDYILAIIEKLDDLVELQHSNNRTGEEHLQHAKAN